MKLKNSQVQQPCVGESWEISAVPGHESVVSNGPDRGKSLAELIRQHREALVGKHVYRRYGDTFPLLVKIIDAKRDLSVQVHPDDALAAKRHNSLGKTEMWYVLHTEPNAKIYSGFKKKIDAAGYTRLVAEDKIMDVVAAAEAQPGDVFFLPAGRIHAIGGGNLLAEIQETSDITYRVYDYGRLDADGKPRQLHTAEARDALDYTVSPDYKTHYDHALPHVRLVECEHFAIDRYVVSGEIELPMPDDSFFILMCVEGECSIIVDEAAALSLRKGFTALVPASAASLRICGDATLLTAQS